ncbi:hypothetical protein G7Y89_g11441 [Cudoniella acicularis]|uniref:Peptidase A1 domain-containing protein n=1 Tax=Cudoniella acicularis TaxID=354080 RepID=A0A8H4VXU9_9HELO|nr:hypothetical protein G7Y89_g11441 [Cudoniella acicularis]
MGDEKQIFQNQQEKVMLALGRAALPQRLKILIVFISFHCEALCDPSEIHDRGAVPAPIVLSPSQQWEGNDGPWSTFAIQIGTPPQTVKVLISTASNQIWAVTPEGCVAGDSINCETLRGEVYNYTDSTTYVPNTANISSSIYDLGLEEQFGLSGKGRYGFDDVTLGWQGSGGPTLKNQTVAGIATKDFYMGLFGLVPRPSNFTNFNNPIPSFMQNLRNQSLIPSTSWAYTAGNQYRLNSVLGSLTLGGYDNSRFIPNTVYFPLASDFVVQIQSITTNNSVSLLSAPLTSTLDSTIPYIYLPNTTCALFEKAFGLIWNDTASLYLLNDTQHTALKTQNPTITFSVSPESSTSTVNVTLPYSAFDLTATAPLVNGTSYYFPLKRSNDTVPSVIGRTFFQEAYLIADYDRLNFSISQCNWNGNLSQSIVAILPPSNSTSSTATTSPGIPIGAIVGIAVGGLFFLLACGAVVYLYLIKPRRQHTEEATAAEIARLDPNRQNDILKPEMDGTGVAGQDAAYKNEPVEADSSKITPAVEAPGVDLSPVFELPAREEVAFEMTAQHPAANQASAQRSRNKRLFARRNRRSETSDEMIVSPDSPENRTNLLSPVSPQTTEGVSTYSTTASSDVLRQMGFPPSTSPRRSGEGTFSSRASSGIYQQMGYHNVLSTAPSSDPGPAPDEGTFSSTASSDILGVLGFPAVASRDDAASPARLPGEETNAFSFVPGQDNIAVAGRTLTTPAPGEGTGAFSFIAGSDHIGPRSTAATPSPSENLYDTRTGTFDSEKGHYSSPPGGGTFDSNATYDQRRFPSSRSAATSSVPGEGTLDSATSSEILDMMGFRDALRQNSEQDIEPGPLVPRPLSVPVARRPVGAGGRGQGRVLREEGGRAGDEDENNNGNEEGNGSYRPYRGSPT